MVKTTDEWTNWSGSVHFRPEIMAKPRDEEEVRQLVASTRDRKKNIRIVGSGHSSVPLVQTDYVLVSQEHLCGLVEHDPKTSRARIRPGTTVNDTGEQLIRLGLAMHNTGDVDYQCLAGAFGTGTHGSGREMQNLAAMLEGCRLVDGRGEVRSYNIDEHPEHIRALRVSLGALGFLTELTIRVEAAVEYERREYCTHIDTCLAHLHELIDGNRMFDFYWYPRSDLAKLRTCNPIGEGMQNILFAEPLEYSKGYLYQILPQKRTLKYEEMEYAVPLEAGSDCFSEVRRRVKERHRHYVGWRVLYRTIAADDGYLSPFSGRDSVTIAVLQNHQLEYKKYFDDIEPVFRAHEGRPHWGKKHTLKAPTLAALYPCWDEFLRFRQELDPDGIFLNDYLKELFGL